MNEFLFPPVDRDVDDIYRRQVAKPRTLEIEVQQARQTFPPEDHGRSANHWLILSGTVVFAQYEGDPAEIEESEQGIVDRTMALRLRIGHISLRGSASVAAEASINNIGGQDDYGLKVENSLVRMNDDDGYLMSDVGANKFGELARLAYQVNILHSVEVSKSQVINGLLREIIDEQKQEGSLRRVGT